MSHMSMVTGLGNDTASLRVPHCILCALIAPGIGWPGHRLALSLPVVPEAISGAAVPSPMFHPKFGDKHWSLHVPGALREKNQGTNSENTQLSGGFCSPGFRCCPNQSSFSTKCPADRSCVPPRGKPPPRTKFFSTTQTPW